MNILIVPAVSVREGEFVYPGEIQVIDYKDHIQEVCRLGSLLECAQGDLNQAMKINAYDEAKERELFASWWTETEILSENKLTLAEKAWLACAKSRAGIQS